MDGRTGHLFRLEHSDGTPANPARFGASRPDWPAGSLIHRGKQTLRVAGRRDDDADRPPVPVVEDA